MPDTRLRRAICRAYNVFTADQFRGLEDRIIPAAIIPMYTPEEAIEELEFAARQLGYKVMRSEEHTSELQSQSNLVCRLLLEKKKKKNKEHMMPTSNKREDKTTTSA